MEKDYVVLDTETTGLEDYDQIVEIAIVDSNGQTLIDARLKPTVEIHPKAQAVHGISKDDLVNSPDWLEAEPFIKKALIGKKVVIFNADFDTKLLKQTATAFECDTTWIDELDTHCAMYQAASIYGATNKYGTIGLANAVIKAGVKWEGEAHSALGDALTTLALYKQMTFQPFVKHKPKKISPAKVKAASEEMMRMGRSSDSVERAKYDRLKQEAQELRKIANKHLNS